MHRMRHHGLPFLFFNKPVSGRYLLIDTAGGVADPMRLPAVEHDRSRVSSCCRCSAAPPSRRVLGSDQLDTPSPRSDRGLRALPRQRPSMVGSKRYRWITNC
jgi:hypothetical protein